MNGKTPADKLAKWLEEAASVPDLAWQDLASGKAWTRTTFTPEGGLKVERIDPYEKGPAPD